MTCVASGHENGSINIFDYNSNKVIQELEKVHGDAVSALSYSNSGLHLVSGSHDGTIKIFDIRKWEILQQLDKVHERKYDESLLCIGMHPS